MPTRSPDTEPLLSKAERGEGGTREIRLEESGGTDILQFSSHLYFVDEHEFGDDHAAILRTDVVRVGSAKGRVAVKYSTEASTAGPHQYDQVSGQLVFEDGEQKKTISVSCYDDGEWEQTSDFYVHLEDAQNCKISDFFNRCRVIIINKEAFPSQVHADACLSEDMEQIKNISDWSLFSEYCELNYKSAGVQWQTQMVMLLDQVSNVCLFVTLCVGVYIVDVIFARGAKNSHKLLMPDKYHTAMIIAVWYMIAVALVYMCDFIKALTDIKGNSREFLQCSLMNTCTNYTRKSRAKANTTQIRELLSTEADDVASGYMAAVNMVGICGKLLTIAIFMVWYQPEPLALAMVAFMVLLLVILSLLRIEKLKEKQDVVTEATDRVDLLTEEAAHKMQLLSDYWKRPWVTRTFNEACRGYSEAVIPVQVVKLNAMYGAKFIAAAGISLYIILMTPRVLDESLSLGIFLATITIFSTYLADALNDFDHNLLEILNAFESLKDFAFVMNLELELQSQKKCLQERFAINEQKKAKMPGPEVQNGIFKCDKVNIEAMAMTFWYNPNNPVLENVNLSIPQGQVVAITGQHKAGKKTFMELISNILDPVSGTWFVPSHLRQVHVSREAVLLQSSLMGNLCLGLPEKTAVEITSLFSILKLCGLYELATTLERQGYKEGNQYVHSLNNEEMAFDPFTSSGWQHHLTHSQCLRLHIARALISHPEVLMIQRTIDTLNERDAADMLDAFNLHVKERGLGLPMGTKGERRPCTVFFTSERADLCMKADTILMVDEKIKSIVELDKRNAKRIIGEFRSDFEGSRQDYSARRESFGAILGRR